MTQAYLLDHLPHPTSFPAAPVAFAETATRSHEPEFYSRCNHRTTGSKGPCHDRGGERDISSECSKHIFRCWKEQQNKWLGIKPTCLSLSRQRQEIVIPGDVAIKLEEGVAFGTIWCLLNTSYRSSVQMDPSFPHMWRADFYGEGNDIRLFDIENNSYRGGKQLRQGCNMIRHRRVVLKPTGRKEYGITKATDEMPATPG
ncbi:hypothetical protein RRG08_040426 [Elysia crispata]|uniref:Uncharacterized protein n=1 Tax=Elysia crispata TaxID=231223 RepID=A0AAE1DEW7_9GAST|nr:hypothetical protein RRG08_040426 [Elysia crispata]